MPRTVWDQAERELTALDLTDRPDRGGGVNNVATVLYELAEDAGLSGTALAELSQQFPAGAWGTCLRPSAPRSSWTHYATPSAPVRSPGHRC